VPFRKTYLFFGDAWSKRMPVISVIVGSTREGRFHGKSPRSGSSAKHLKRARGFVDARLSIFETFRCTFFDPAATRPRRVARPYKENR